MSSTWGNQLKISIFGESHSGGIGVVIDGLPAGEPIDLEEIQGQMARRAPGQDKTATPRREADAPQILSGLIGGKTEGTPLAAVIGNTNTRSGDYENLMDCPRPGHGDYTGYLRYKGANDLRGGGHFSGRLTAPLTFAGAVARQILARRGIVIGAHALSVAGVRDEAFDPVGVSPALLERLNREYFPVIFPQAKEKMRAAVEEARLAGDSVGGVIECALTGVPAGLGSPMFGGVENVFSGILFGIPAVKGVEFGAGFAVETLRGSENNDGFCVDGDGRVQTRTNHCGGILGGITTGMPLLFRAAVKPTPSISIEQSSVNLQTKESQKLVVHGRHDPCIVPRAIPVAEAAAALALLDIMLTDGGLYGCE